MSEALNLTVGESVPTPVNDVTIEAAAAEIRHFAGAASLEFACTVGRIVLDRFYGGDVDAFRAHGRKDVSLRRLADRLDGGLNLSASTLARCVAIHSVLTQLGPLSQWRNLTPKHVRAVLQLPQPERARLLGEADRHGWSARQLEQVTRPARARSPGARGQAATLLRTMDRYDEELRADGRLFAAVKQLGALAPDELERGYVTVQRVREKLERLQRAMSLKKHGVMDGARRASPASKAPGRSSRR